MSSLQPRNSKLSEGDIQTTIMHSFRRAGLAGFSAAMLLLSALPTVPASAQAAPDISISDASVTEGGLAQFTVSVVGAHPAFTVDYATRAGTALEPADYATTTGTLTIGSNKTSATISVQTVAEKMLESDEVFYVDLDPLSTIANVTDSEGEGTILNDDPIPSFSVNDVMVGEGDSGLVDAVFDVSVTNAASTDMTVNYHTVPGTALGGGDDYRNASGTLTFPAGNSATQQVVVKVKGDTVREDYENFTLKLTGAVNAVIGDSEGKGTIRNDDAKPVLSLGTSTVNINEGNGGLPILITLVTVSASNASDSDVTFTASTSNGTALGGSDYNELNSVLYTMPAGSTSARVSLTVKGDTLKESDENFFLIIDNPTNATLGNSVQEIVIKNDD